MSAFFILIPIVNLAYYLMARERTLDAAVFALKLIYLGGCFLPWVTTMCLFGLCRSFFSHFSSSPSVCGKLP